MPAAPSLLRSMLSFSGGTFVSRLLGLVREMVIAWTFGANATTDAFWVAFRIPNFMRRLFAEGSFAAAFVPVLTEVKERGSAEALRELIARAAGTLGGILLVVTALGIVCADGVTRVFAPGSIDDPAKLALTSDLLRLTFPYLLFISLTALAGSVLNSFHRFALPALTPVIFNLCMIAGALWLAPRLTVPITALGWAVMAAGVLQLLFQLPALRGLDLLTLPKWGWRHPDVRKVIRLMVPTLFGSSVAQINLLLDTVIAALLFVGSQTWLSQADRFLELPLGVFGIALGTVILPTLSRHHVNTDHAGFSRALDWGLRTTLMIAIPAMLGLMLLSVPLVATLFQHRAFRPFDTEMTAMSVFGLSSGLPSFALVKVLLPAFYARQDTRTPVKAGLVSLVANMVFNVAILAVLYGLWVKPELRDGPILVALAQTPGLHLALGLASALASYLNLWLLWRWLRRDGIYQPLPGWGRYTVRLLASCAAMTGAVLLGLHWAPDFTVVGLWQRVGWLIALVATGVVVYAGTMVAMGFRPRELREH